MRNCLFFFFRQLIGHLKVFSKFTNPRALYMEGSLCELYNQVILWFSTQSKLPFNVKATSSYFKLLTNEVLSNMLCCNLQFTMFVMSQRGEGNQTNAFLSNCFLSHLCRSCSAIRTRESSKWLWNASSHTKIPTSFHTSEQTAPHTSPALPRPCRGTVSCSLQSSVESLRGPSKRNGSFSSYCPILFVIRQTCFPRDACALFKL